MVSKSAELLAGADIEGSLAFIDSDILAEPNSLGLSSQLQFPKYRIVIQTAIFYAKILEKHVKQKED